MRRMDKSISDPSIIEAIFRKAFVCRIALVDGNEPYLVPVNFGFAKDRLYFHSATEGRKIDLIRKNPRVCIEVESDVEILTSSLPCEFSTRYRSVIAFGYAEILEKPEEKSAALQLIVKHYSEEAGAVEIPGRALESVAVVRINIERVTAKQSEFDSR